MRVTLSFDNGPTPGVTEAVLDLLARRRLSAWFFPIGRNVVSHRHLVARAKAEGHCIGNHTFTHTVPLGELPIDRAIGEIERAQAVLGDLAEDPPTFRPFGRGGRIGPHLSSPAVDEHLAAKGYRIAMWNNVPGDWHDPEGWVETALATMADQEASGGDHSIVVLHDIDGACLARLDDFLNALQASNVTFTVDLH